MDEGVYSPVKRDGKTAVFHLRLQEPTVNGNGHIYKFQQRRGVSLAWIEDADVESILLITERCCGGKPRHNFLLANNRQVEVWENSVR